MFKKKSFKINANKKSVVINLNEEDDDLKSGNNKVTNNNKRPLKTEGNTNDILDITIEEVNTKSKISKRNIPGIPINLQTNYNLSNQSKNSDTQIQTQANNQFSAIHRVFLPEDLLKNSKDKDQINTIYENPSQEAEKIKRNRKSQIDEFLKQELYTLPENLKPRQREGEDYVDNLLKMSQKGLVEVNLPIEQRLRAFENTEKEYISKNIHLEDDMQEYVLKEDRKGEVIDYKKHNNSKNQRQNEYKKIFNEVFMNFNGRKRKLQKEELIKENRKIESDQHL